MSNRILRREAQVQARDVIEGDVVLVGRVWREVLGVARTAEEAATEWSWTSIANHANDSWVRGRNSQVPEIPTVVHDAEWGFPAGLAGIAMTGFEGVDEYVAIRLLALGTGEADSLTMISPRASLVTIQVPE